MRPQSEVLDRTSGCGLVFELAQRARVGVSELHVDLRARSEVLDQLEWWRENRKTPVEHHGESVAALLQIGKQVRRHDDRRAARTYFIEHPEEHIEALCVQPDHRL